MTTHRCGCPPNYSFYYPTPSNYSETPSVTISRHDSPITSPLFSDASDSLCLKHRRLATDRPLTMPTDAILLSVVSTHLSFTVSLLVLISYRPGTYRSHLRSPPFFSFPCYCTMKRCRTHCDDAPQQLIVLDTTYSIDYRVRRYCVSLSLSFSCLKPFLLPSNTVHAHAPLPEFVCLYARQIVSAL